ncbi:Domain of unknown function (DUF543) [Nesidiocoris tenuis]|uniref:MICOS complex subunit MIC10 n=1 Tax=Nesidiocoris tenuis TaxID=355587 RepID=A0ABN7A8K4_9HEMI|nr:Domain of unknown function (DUF543) [Nesidiocoris tenuis]
MEKCSAGPQCMPEDRYGMYVQYCVKDHLWKTGAGISAGWLIAKLLTKPNRFTCKKRTWPIILGMGMGVGLASEYCKREFNHSLSDRRKRLQRQRHNRRRNESIGEPTLDFSSRGQC